VARFKSHKRWRQLLEKCNHLVPRHLSAKYWLFGRIYTMQLINTLRRVDANSDNLLHGRLPLFEICNDLILAHRCRRGPSTPTELGSAVSCQETLCALAAYVISNALDPRHSPGMTILLEEAGDTWLTRNSIWSS